MASRDLISHPVSATLWGLTAIVAAVASEEDMGIHIQEIAEVMAVIETLDIGDLSICLFVWDDMGRMAVG